MSLPLQEQHDTHLQMPQEKTELVSERADDSQVTSIHSNCDFRPVSGKATVCIN